MKEKWCASIGSRRHPVAAIKDFNIAMAITSHDLKGKICCLKLFGLPRKRSLIKLVRSYVNFSAVASRESLTPPPN